MINDRLSQINLKLEEAEEKKVEDPHSSYKKNLNLFIEMEHLRLLSFGVMDGVPEA